MSMVFSQLLFINHTAIVMLVVGFFIVL
jgi:hypothetical protein